MRSLQRTLKALSPLPYSRVGPLRKTSGARAASPQFKDTLFDADGARYNGTLIVKWSTFDANNPGTVIQQSKSVGRW